MKNKKILIPLLIVVTGTVGVLGYWYFTSHAGPRTQNDRPPYEINYEPATEEQKKPAIDTPSVKDDSKMGSPNDSNSSTLTATITAANVNGNVLQIRSLIAPLVSSGVCRLTLTMPGQQTITSTAPIQAMSSSSTCKGFDVDTSSLARGTWHISLQASSDSQNAQASKDINIE